MAENFDFITTHTEEYDGDAFAKFKDADNDVNRVLDSAMANSLFIRWHTEGTMVNLVAGEWQVEAYLIPIFPAGVAIPLVIPGNPFPLLPHPAAWNVTVPIAPGTVPNGLYKALVTFTHINMGVPTRMGGFVEIPMVRFM